MAQGRQGHPRARPARTEQGRRPAVEPRDGSESPAKNVIADSRLKRHRPPKTAHPPAATGSLVHVCARPTHGPEIAAELAERANSRCAREGIARHDTPTLSPIWRVYYLAWPTSAAVRAGRHPIVTRGTRRSRRIASRHRRCEFRGRHTGVSRTRRRHVSAVAAACPCTADVVTVALPAGVAGTYSVVVQNQNKSAAINVAIGVRGPRGEQGERASPGDRAWPEPQANRVSRANTRTCGGFKASQGLQGAGAAGRSGIAGRPRSPGSAGFPEGLQGTTGATGEQGRVG